MIGFFALGIVGFSMGHIFFLQDNTDAIPAWIWTTLVGFVVGALLGGVGGALVGIGTPPRAAKRYHFYLNEDGLLLGVQVQNQDENKKATEVLEKMGAQDILTMDESKVLKTLDEEVTI